MTQETLDIYKTHLDEQLGEDGVFTQLATYDPSGENVQISGIFEDYSLRGRKDAGNVMQKLNRALFLVSDILSFDIYLKKELYLPYENKTLIIDYIDKDSSGAQVLWLY